MALAEVEYHKALCHPNIVECIDSDLVGVPDLVGNRTSQVLILLPYYQVGHSSPMKYVSLIKDIIAYEYIVLLAS